MDKFDERAREIFQSSSPWEVVPRFAQALRDVAREVREEALMDGRQEIINWLHEHHYYYASRDLQALYPIRAAKEVMPTVPESQQSIGSAVTQPGVEQAGSGHECAATQLLRKIYPYIERLNHFHLPGGEILYASAVWDVLHEAAPAQARPSSTRTPEPHEAFIQEGHGSPCYYCGEKCNNLTGDPGKWPVGLCHSDEPGVVKWHHSGCVSDRLEDLARMAQPCPSGMTRDQLHERLSKRLKVWERRGPSATDIATDVLDELEQCGALQSVAGSEDTRVKQERLRILAAIEEMAHFYGEGGTAWVLRNLKQVVSEVEAVDSASMRT